MVKESIELISINATLIVQLISFLIFLFVINRIMFRPLRRVMDERDSYVEKIRQEIVAADRDLENYAGQMEKQKETQQQEAFASTIVLETEGRNEAHEIIQQAGKEIAVLREDALKDIRAQLALAQNEIQAEAQKLAVGIMEKVLERRLAP